jgi:hypothetical protein
MSTENSVLYFPKSALTLVFNYCKILCLIFGGVPERPKGADCKSAGSTFEGSNPSPSTSLCPVGYGWHASCRA